MLRAPWGWLPFLGLIAELIATGCAGHPTSPNPDTSPHVASTAALPATTSRPVASPTATVTRPAGTPPRSALAPAPVPSSTVAARPYLLHVPAGYQRTNPAPLLVVLHGLGASGRIASRVLELGALADETGVLIAAPDGTRDSHGRRFWNATDACCDFERRAVADARYLAELIDDVSARHSVDPSRVFVVGYSNGGFMAHRAACDLSGLVAGVASFSGASWAEPSRCDAREAVTVLQIHGDADPTVAYGGGQLTERDDLPPFPGARKTVGAWAARNQCDPSAIAEQPGPPISDKQTTRLRYTQCRAAPVELWTVHQGGHLIGMRRRDLRAALAFLMSHPKTRGGTAHERVARAN